MSFFCLISIRLSRFHDSNHGFDGLNQLTWVIFFIYPSLKLVKQYGKHYNKLNKSQQDKILLIKKTFSLFTRFLFTFSLLSQIRKQKINIMNLATKNKIIKTKGNEKGIQKEIGGHRRTFLREF